MEKVYEISFYTGVILTVVSFLLGQLLDVINFDGIDFDIELPGLNMFSIKPLLIVMFASIFGGIGMILTRNEVNEYLTVGISVVSGLSLCYFTDYAIIRPLKRRQTQVVSIKDLINIEANAKLDIGKNVFGEITYVVNGNTYSAPAKSTKKFIKSGSRVIIKKIENNIFYVEKKEEDK